jgi:AcrR family transcriptional regulator
VSADARREQLIAATLTVMAESGLDAATSRRIAEAAGAPLASIHYTFGSLEALLAAAYARALDQVLERLAAAVPCERGFALAFERLADAVVDLLADPAFGILFLELSPAQHVQLVDIGTRYYEFGEALVRKIASASHVAVPDDAVQLGRLVSASIDGVSTRFALDRDADAARADLRRLLALLAPATRTRPRKSAPRVG